MIPDGWSALKLTDVANIKRGAGSQYINYVDKPEDGVRLIRISDFLGDNPKYIERTTAIERFLLHEGDLLIAGTGATAGITFEIPKELVGLAFSYNAPRIRVKKGADKSYILYYLKSGAILKQQHALFTGNAQPFLDTNAIAGFKIYIPPLPEQKKIAQILSTWDKAIETVGKLIANSQQKKKALMQQLLTGKKRFPSFDGEWKQLLLGDVGEISSAGVDKKTIEDEKPVRLLNYLDVLNRDFIADEELNHWVTAPERKVKNCDIQQGDVFFTPSSETRDDIAHSAVAIEAIPNAVYSYHIVRFRLHQKWDLLFRTYAFKTPSFYKQAYSLCEGSGQRYVISQRYFRNMTVCIPLAIEEQQKIASALSSAHREIETWQQELEHLKQEKKALMQQLLTGKCRVKVN